MKQDQIFELLLDDFYEAVAMCDERLMSVRAESLLNFMKEDKTDSSSSKQLTVKVDTPTINTMNAFLDAYQERLKVNVDACEMVEAEVLSNISSYCFDKTIDFRHPEMSSKGFSIIFKPLQIKAVIDWLDLSFEVDPKICTFATDSTARSYIKSFLTKNTGKKHYVKHDESDINQDGLAFTVRLHDIKSKSDLLIITDLLEKQYGADISKMKIQAIELSLDFYHANSKGLLCALYKSIRYEPTANNARIYKYMKDDFRNKFTPVPESPLQLLKYFDDDWCLGVNRKGSPLCYRLYVKTTDKNKQPLPQEDHRLRVEITLNQTILKDHECSIGNLKDIIKYGFKFLRFTTLDKKTDEEFKQTYHQVINIYGKETKGFNLNGNKRYLREGIKTHVELNNIVSKAVSNLYRNF